MLMSLAQMRNLRFNIALTPMGATLRSDVLGENVISLAVSTTRHLVIDLASIKGQRAALNSLDTQGTDCPSFLAETAEAHQKRQEAKVHSLP